MSEYNDKYVAGLELDVIQLREQLAKANEKITGLNLRIDKQRESLKKQYSRNEIAESELAKANERVEGILNGDMTPEDYYKISSSKFAIEKKIEAAIFYGEKLKEIGFSGVDSYTDQIKEMLRKEQDNESD